MKIETKYNLGHKVWLIFDSKIRECSIDEIIIYVTVAGKKTKYMARANMMDTLQLFYENDLFASKKELINSLLD